jgi:hypothetical protein
MRSLAGICLVAILAAASCRGAAVSEQIAKPPAGWPAVVLTSLGNPSSDSAATRDVRLEVFMDKVLAASGLTSNDNFTGALYGSLPRLLPQNRKPAVVIRTDDGIQYADVAIVMLAFTKLGVYDFNLDGEQVRFPSVVHSYSDDPFFVKRPRYLPEERGPEVILSVRLYDVSPSGEYDPDGVNDWLQIMVEDRPMQPDEGLPKDRLAAGKASLKALAALFDEKLQAGLPPDTPIRIHPTMGCRQTWVVAACKTARDAGFKNIRLVVPYE